MSLVKVTLEDIRKECPYSLVLYLSQYLESNTDHKGSFLPSTDNSIPPFYQIFFASLYKDTAESLYFDMATKLPFIRATSLSKLTILHT